LDNAELEKRISELEARVSKLEGLAATSPGQTTHNDVEDALIDMIDDIGIQNLIILSLRLKGPATREQIRQTLDNWGKAYGSWFRGGNFNARLVDKGIVKLNSTTDNGGEIYALTKKGERVADQLTAEITSKTKDS
jgi:hypothetical protein